MAATETETELLHDTQRRGILQQGWEHSQVACSFPPPTQEFLSPPAVDLRPQVNRALNILRAERTHSNQNQLALSTQHDKYSCTTTELTANNLYKV